MKNKAYIKGSITFYLTPALVFLGIFLYLTLFQNMKLFQFIGIYLIAPIFSIIIFIVMYRSLRKNIMDKNMVLKYTLIIFIFSYILLESIFLIINIHNLFSLILLIPVDLIIIAIPVYLNYRDKMPYKGNPGEYSQDLTNNLRNITGETIEVYISDFSRANLYGATTHGNDWKLIIYRIAFEKFNNNELLSFMLQLYYNKRLNVNRNILRSIFFWLVLIIDMLFLSYILSMELPKKYGIYFLPFLILSFALIILTPLIINKIMINGNKIIDKKILEKTGDIESLKSMILKNADREPLRPLPQYQYKKYKARMRKYAYMRIKNMEKY